MPGMGSFESPPTDCGRDRPPCGSIRGCGPYKRVKPPAIRPGSPLAHGGPACSGRSGRPSGRSSRTGFPRADRRKVQGHLGAGLPDWWSLGVSARTVGDHSYQVAPWRPAEVVGPSMRGLSSRGRRRLLLRRGGAARGAQWWPANRCSKAAPPPLGRSPAGPKCPIGRPLGEPAWCL
jgi:hypothetical protein